MHDPTSNTMSSQMASSNQCNTLPQPNFRNKNWAKSFEKASVGESLEKVWRKLGESLEKAWRKFGEKVHVVWLSLPTKPPCSSCSSLQAWYFSLLLWPGSRLLCAHCSVSLFSHSRIITSVAVDLYFPGRAPSINRSISRCFVSSSAAGLRRTWHWFSQARYLQRSEFGWELIREEAYMAAVRGGGLVLVAMAAMVLAMTAAGAKAAPMEYVVKWDFPTTEPYYSATQGRTYKVGDKLKFVYRQEMHNVVKVGSVADYTKCTTSTALSPEYADGETSLTLDHDGAHYFICSIPGHCADGMKIKVVARA